MKKRISLILLSGMLALSSLCGCADDEDWDEDSGYEEENEDEETVKPEKSEDDDKPDEKTTSSSGLSRGLSMSLDKQSGSLKITRKSTSTAPVKGDDGVWTVFVYLCGTDLESGGGMATADLNEMLEAEASDKVRFVVETGGADEWWNEAVESDKLQRYVVTDGDIELVDEVSRKGMGKASTLQDFLKWGCDNYASEHMGLVFWNHGGGSITGVCFDETDNNDALLLSEIDEALYTWLDKSGRKFDFVGFDACLMGTIETANVIASYADYMCGSEELEPGSGWDYTEIGDFLADNPDADGAELGKVVCDSFLAACKAEDDDDLTTLSVIDLSKMDDLLVSFNDFAQRMYEAGEDAAKRAGMVRSIEAADNFGGNNKTEGYTNMVDMGGIIEACSSEVSGADKARSALDQAVVYKVSGSAHRGATGISMYYPLTIGGSLELTTFGQICVSPYYLAFVDRQNQTGAGAIGSGEYDDSGLYDDEGYWDWGDEEDDGYWDYMDDYEQTGESPYISFEMEPGFDEDGVFCFMLDDEGWFNASDVNAIVYELTEDMDAMIELGETIDVTADWDYGYFEDNFDGYWLSLPDGQNLATYIVDITDEYVIYTSPVMLNDEETNLRLKQYFADGSVVVEGAWDGIDEYGAASRDIIKLKSGDVIVPLYYAYSLEDDDDEFQYVGTEYKVSGTIDISYDIMESGDYLYSFCIDDIYGDYYLTDPVMFNVDEDGEVTFYEE